MDCPICLTSIDSDDVEFLARHLRERHKFERWDAGRTARRVQEWERCNASHARSVKGSPVPVAGDDSGGGGEPDRDRCGMGGREFLTAAIQCRAAVAGSRVSPAP